jgi:hypothetical protein
LKINKGKQMSSKLIKILEYRKKNTPSYMFSLTTLLTTPSEYMTASPSNWFFLFFPHNGPFFSHSLSAVCSNNEKWRKWYSFLFHDQSHLWIVNVDIWSLPFAFKQWPKSNTGVTIYDWIDSSIVLLLPLSMLLEHV